MIIGLFQRHYKIYKGFSFIPFHSEDPETLSVIIGNNGCGKSSILEAVDTFFNNRIFNINIGSKKGEAFVAPLLLFEKEKLKNFTPSNQKYIEVLSDFLWEEKASNSNYKPIKNYFSFRKNNLLKYRDTHILLVLSKEFDNGNQYFFTFTGSVQKKFKEAGLQPFKPKEYNALISRLRKVYTYLYIPIETSIEDFLRIETEGMQNLIDKKISSEIDKTLTDKRITRATGPNRTKKISLLDIINENLKRYINDTERTIKTIYKGYDFKMQYKAKQNLTASDIKEQIIYSYLSKRTLKKDDKPIRNLSAGERKKALIDIAYSFISGAKDRDSEIILAIDEPESSLHISNCYDQFIRIEEISEAKNCQVLLTTHWYGSLPILNKGTLIQIELDTDTPKHRRFNFQNYFEDRGSHPNDIQLKSFYDLTSSIISSLKHYSTNWLIVEGTDDFNYLSKNLRIKNLKILPVGGCGVVKLLYDFLYVPMSHKSEALDVKGKILCLTDTDLMGPELQHSSETRSNKLKFRRLQIIDGKVTLVKNEHQARMPLEIEEAIDPNDFFKCLSQTINLHGDEELKKDLINFSVSKNASCSQIKGDYSMLTFNGAASDMISNKEKIMNFIEKNKEKISKEYKELIVTSKPKWMNEIEDYFNL
ncbi:hypothetical protein DZC72_05005 [Maribacter algicola]|uniref:Endonuclease GajA/Old nuclease/RecF-like AAA domain-containing protein n=1 Tax=Maribacter algicola TaxID=2498892 RepID=A0A426RLQ8_9FLAO|nr:AAA family ATPase [Maribacter algicola]RRQ49946.1 hypothetical protein DZC72_05005 [Maribacter algicola]